MSIALVPSRRLPAQSARASLSMLAATVLGLAVVAADWRFILHRLRDIFLSDASRFSVASLLLTGIFALSAIAFRRRARGRRLNLRLLFRALLPGWLLRSASMRLDIVLFVMNGLFTTSLVGSTFLSFPFVEHGFARLLAVPFGPSTAAATASTPAIALQTVALYLAFELAYYIDHYTCHSIGFFWELHRVHHTAEVLTPITSLRLHPLEQIKAQNITVVVTALTAAVLGRWLPAVEWTLNGTNVLIVAVYLCLNHLHHTHLWLPITGPLGRVIASPAHHQMHHSDDPAYARCNLGWSLSVFDWLFGTLRVPGWNKPPMRFGVDSGPADNHSVMGAVVMPVVRAVRSLA
jgi:sterol desaturase/sphingolipid hydroxylase (fatty acid hydroxylase superfamily)